MQPQTPNNKRVSTSVPPSRKWQKKFPCKVNKGEHTFELVKPKFSEHREDTKAMSVEEYYKKEGAMDGQGGTLYFYQCTACGKNEIKLL
jgi:hypothetical protein